MTLYPVGGSFSIDGVHSDAWNMFCRNWSHSHQAVPRTNHIDIPGRTGKFAQKMELSSKLFSFDMAIYNVLGRAAAIQNLVDFAAATDPRNGLHQLILLDDRPGWWLGITPSSLGSGSTNVTITQSTLGHIQFTVSLEAPDPRWYKTTPVSFSWNPRPPGTAVTTTLNNTGTDRAQPVFTIAHPGGAGVLTGVRLAYNGSTFTYNGSLISGDVLVVDMANWTVMKNGNNDIVNWAGDDFPSLAGTVSDLAQFTPPRTPPVATVLTWSDTNNVGANITGTYTERQV